MTVKTSTAYLNGEFLPLEEAQVSAMDRGFLFGDGVYEVIPVFSGQLFRLEQHIARLKQSLKSIHLNIDFEKVIPHSIFKQLVKLNGDGDQTLYLQITRGSNLERNLVFPKDIHPTVFAFCSLLPPQPIDVLAKGSVAITLPDIRWLYCSTKAITLLANVLLRNEAHRQGANEAILIRDGKALECASSNLFIVQKGTIITPPLSDEILGGITRELILELAQEHQMPHKQQEITVFELENADEIWITASGKEIVPVLKLNNLPVGGGKPGPMWYKMIEYYQSYKRSYKSDEQ